MKILKRLIVGLVFSVMLVMNAGVVFANETQNQVPLEKLQSLSISSLSEDIAIDSKDEIVKSSEKMDPYVLPMERNNMIQVAIEAQPIAYNPTTNEAGIFNNYKQTFMGSGRNEFLGGFVYEDEMKTIEEFFQLYGYEVIGWHTIASYYFETDRPVDYYYSCNGWEEVRVPLTTADNMILYQCTFNKILAEGESDGTYTTEFTGRYGHKTDTGSTVYAAFRSGISFNVKQN